MEATTDLKVGDVVQINGQIKDSFFAGCFMTVTDPKPWGAQGYIAVPQNAVKYQEPPTFEPSGKIWNLLDEPSGH